MLSTAPPIPSSPISRRRLSCATAARTEIDEARAYRCAFVIAVAGLHELAADLHERGTELWVASLTPGERRMVERYGEADALTLFATPEDALTAARSVGSER